jgi:hypothetical protein
MTPRTSESSWSRSLLIILSAVTCCDIDLTGSPFGVVW